MLHRIVITGAPASGKTLFFERLKKEPLLTEFIFFDELARELLEQNQEYRTNWKQFHIDIYQHQTNREQKYRNNSFITDRGTVDTFAFYPETAQHVDSHISKEYERYTAVLLLESSATLGKKYYKTDNIRQESIDEAIKIENQLIKAWSEHPNYYCIQAENSIERKFSAFKKIILGIIDEKI